MEEDVKPIYMSIPFEADEFVGVLSEVDIILENTDLYQRMADRYGLGQYQSGIGSTDAWVDN